MKGVDRRRLTLLVAFAAVLLFAVVIKPHLGGGATASNDAPVPLSAQVTTTVVGSVAPPIGDPGRDPFKALIDEMPTPPPPTTTTSAPAPRTAAPPP